MRAIGKGVSAFSHIYEECSAQKRQHGNLASGARNITTVPTQALVLMNDDFVLKQAQLFANRLEEVAPGDRSKQIELAYRMPHYALWIVAFVGAVIGLCFLPVLGKVILAARKALGFAIAATLRVSVAAATSAAVYIGISLINAHR